LKLELAVQLDGQFKDTNRVKRYGEDAVAWLIGVPERSISRFPWGEVGSRRRASAVIIGSLVGNVMNPKSGPNSVIARELSDRGNLTAQN